jgi:hypothetical protein
MSRLCICKSLLVLVSSYIYLNLSFYLMLLLSLISHAHFMFTFPCIIRLYYIKDQQDATLAVCLLVTASLLIYFYMFRTLSVSIIRSTKNCISSHWCVSCCNYKATYKQVLCVIQVVKEYNRTVLGCIELKANIKYICYG